MQSLKHTGAELCKGKFSRRIEINKHDLSALGSASALNIMGGHQKFPIRARA